MNPGTLNPRVEGIVTVMGGNTAAKEKKDPLPTTANPKN